MKGEGGEKSNGGCSESEIRHGKKRQSRRGKAEQGRKSRVGRQTEERERENQGGGEERENARGGEGGGHKGDQLNVKGENEKTPRG